VGSRCVKKKRKVKVKGRARGKRVGKVVSGKGGK
jgi:hypothetical protein